MVKSYKRRKIKGLKKQRAKFKTTTKTYKKLSSVISRKRSDKKAKLKKKKPAFVWSFNLK
ncbi:MAG: hypothetical protein COT15_03185 [Candidatus Diapherotrites archaeon CG08_land_8_20_14_0_20_34_12]|nr:MAG: hypothetical protein COT15_03185 [Candidatus Diapherotrites archaeon CG08_land_8_20_14_0_20_34_12]